MIATNNFDDYDNYKNLFLIKDGFKISFHKCKDVIPIIIDKIKKIFGLESMNRKLIVFLLIQNTILKNIEVMKDL